MSREILNRMLDENCERIGCDEVAAARRVMLRMAQAEMGIWLVPAKGGGFVPVEERVKSLLMNRVSFKAIRDTVFEIAPDADDTMTRLALSAMIVTLLEQKQQEQEALDFFLSGDYEAIDLYTEAGRNYLFKHYAIAVKNPSAEGFEQLVAYCLSENEREDKEGEDDESGSSALDALAEETEAEPTKPQPTKTQPISTELSSHANDDFIPPDWVKFCAESLEETEARRAQEYEQWGDFAPRNYPQFRTFHVDNEDCEKPEARFVSCIPLRAPQWRAMFSDYLRTHKPLEIEAIDVLHSSTGYDLHLKPETRDLFKDWLFSTPFLLRAWTWCVSRWIDDGTAIKESDTFTIR